ncbi:MAG: hypothetical protein PVF77_18610, partial [Anaerolineae bacterium]
EADTADERAAVHQDPGPEEEASANQSEELDFLLDDPELERALKEEALAGGPGPGLEEVDLQVTEEGSPVLEVDMAYSEEALAAEAPMEPGTASVEPAVEEPMSEAAWEAMVFEPPPPEASDVVDGVLPPRPERPYLEELEEELAPQDIQEPEVPVLPIELPDRKLTEEEKAQILDWLGAQRIQELESAIDDAYAEVRSTVASNEAIATACTNRLLKARDIVLRRDVAKMAQAEYYVEWVRTRLKRAVDSDAAARKYQWPILIWGLLWFSGLLALLILLNESWFQEAIISPSSSNALVDMEVFLSTIIWGGIGGVVAVLYSLFKHVGQRDFDTHFGLSYIGKPFLGLIIGATVYMAFSLVIRTLGIFPVTVEGTGEVALPSLAPGVMYLVAWVSGFKESRIFDLMDRTMKRTVGGEDRAASSELAL